MKEIEVLVEIFDDINAIKEKFKKFKYVGLKRVIDEYIEGKGTTIKVVLLKEFSKELGEALEE